MAEIDVNTVPKAKKVTKPRAPRVPKAKVAKPAVKPSVRVQGVVPEIKTKQLDAKNEPEDVTIINDNINDSDQHVMTPVKPKWNYLFYDKYAGDTNGNGDHHYNNPITSKLIVGELEDGSYTYYEGNNALQFYNSKFKGNFALPECVYTSELFKLKIYSKIIQNIETTYVVVGVCTTILEEHIRNKTTVPHFDFIKTLCRYHLAYTETTKFINITISNIDNKIDENINFVIANAIKPVDYTFDEKTKNIENSNIELFEYQKCSVYWMINKEKNKKTILYNLNDEVNFDAVYYDNCTQSFGLVENKKAITFHGGGIIDEVGLGKTMQALSLIILKPSSSLAYTDIACKNRFISKATLVLCPNQLCGQWIRECEDRIKADYNLRVVSIRTKRDFDVYTYNDLLDADIVLVSFTFLGNENFSSEWTTSLSNVKSYHKRGWSDNDVQQVRKKFDEMGAKLLANPVESLGMTKPLVQLIKWHRIMIDEFHELYNNDSTYKYVTNLLPHLKADHKWIVTATPFNKKESFHGIMNFLVDYSNIDGKRIYTIEPVIDYLSTDCFRRNTKDSVKGEHTLPHINEEVRWLKFTHTERMMYNAHLTNELNDKYGVYLRQLCCHPQLAEETKGVLSNCKTLADIEKAIVSHYKAQVDEAQAVVDKINLRLKKLDMNIHELELRQKKKQLIKLGFLKKPKPKKTDNDDDFGDEEEEDDGVTEEEVMALIEEVKRRKIKFVVESTMTIDGLKVTVKEQTDKLKEATEELNGKMSTYNFFNNVMEKIKKTANREEGEKEEDDIDKAKPENEDDEMCGICLCEIPEDDIGVTRCGHMFCFECLNLTVNKYHNCPYCKKKLGATDIYSVSYEKKKKPESVSKDDKTKMELVNEIGTKLANIILYLKETNEHTIIFSQWDDLLRKIGRILEINKIPNVFCRGNCYQRDKAIREFNGDNKIKVIMLSSDSTAAGTNLTKASQVIFIEPIYGTYKFRKDQEKQAIGRAHRLGQKSNIKIVRFLIKDTVEETIHMQNLMEDKKHTLDFATSNEITVV